MSFRMCRNPPSSLNVRGLVGLLHRYYRVGGGGGSSGPSTSFSRILVPTATFGRAAGYGGYGGAPYYMNPGLRLFSGSPAGDNIKPDAPLLKSEAKKVNIQDPLAAPKFKIFSWAKWIIGSLLSIIFPFWNGIRKIEGKVEEVVEEVEEIAEVVEKVATAAENVIGAVADKLPTNTILKEAVEAVEHASAQVAEDARNVTVFIHKAEEVKQDLESLETMVEPLVDKIIEESKNDKVNNSL
ncbi:PREDICTED: uncharacterized protein LOC109164889 [Ipomoea nil]|uniref:uncharacterized protein LOC109164889 n=1 Tax=Ipomoea nil TaxID=35883 RepID=UPI000900E088|nr:PREDICTED: uncharacterized protein LOC109164889 [Ipomoea nil]